MGGTKVRVVIVFQAPEVAAVGHVVPVEHGIEGLEVLPLHDVGITGAAHLGIVGKSFAILCYMPLLQSLLDVEIRQYLLRKLVAAEFLKCLPVLSVYLVFPAQCLIMIQWH